MNFHLPLRSLLTVSLLVWLGGCAETLEHVELDPQTVGFEAPLPKAGTRVIVWGNHATAVDQTSTWLHRQGLVILDRTKLEQGFPDKKPRLVGSAKDWPHILEASHRVGADLVAIVEVSNIKGGQKFSLSQVRSSPTFALTVEIRGVKPGTGEIVTKSKAWQTGPAQSPDWIIEDLTARALDGAWLPTVADHMVAEANGEGSEVETDMLQESSPSQVFPGSHIESQSASSRNEFEGNHSESSTSFSRELSIPAEPQTESVPIHKPVLAVSTAMDEQSRSHNEVNSTYLRDLEPIQKAEPGSDISSDDIGPKLASGALSILYTPAKLVYAGLGGIFGGLAYVLSAGDERAVETIWTGCFEGDYYLTPAHLKGDTPLKFMGPSSTPN